MLLPMDLERTSSLFKIARVSGLFVLNDMAPLESRVTSQDVTVGTIE